MWRPVGTIWFILLIVPMGKNHVFEPYKPQSDYDWPSCSELRAMWLSLRDIALQGELTNEIPLIPNDMLHRFYQQRGASHRSRLHDSKQIEALQKNEILQTLEDTNNLKKDGFIRSLFHDLMPDIPDPSNLYPPRQESDEKPSSIISFFGNFDNDIHGGASNPNSILLVDEINQDLDADALDILDLPMLSKSRGHSLNGIPSRDISPFEPQWGYKDEVGSFGKFPDEDGESARRRSKAHSVRPNAFGWHDVLKKPGGPSQAVRKDPTMTTCDEIESQPCSRNSQCQCNGWVPSTCIAGGCHSMSSSSAGDLMDIGAWHDGPLALSKLGLAARRKRRNKRNKFM